VEGGSGRVDVSFWPVAVAPLDDFIATLPTAARRLQRLLRSWLIENSYDSCQS
jgi:hypothetical protein